jgi:hypothetical protein
VPSWIASRIGIDPDETKLADLDAHLLEHLAPACVLHGLADLDEPSRQCIGALEGRVAAADEKHATPSVEDDAIGG